MKWGHKKPEPAEDEDYVREIMPPKTYDLVTKVIEQISEGTDNGAEAVMAVSAVAAVVVNSAKRDDITIEQAARAFTEQLVDICKQLKALDDKIHLDWTDNI